MLANNADGKRARDFTDISATEAGRKRREKERRERILARTQHILVADSTGGLIDFLTPGTKTDEQWFQWNNVREYEITSLQGWKYIPWEWVPHEPSESNKQNILSAITDVTVDSSDISETVRGATIDKRNPNSIHMLFCDGVGEFKIQGWFEAQQRWLPEVDPDGDGLLTDSDFLLDSSGSALDPIKVPGVLYPYPPHGGVSIRDVNYPSIYVNQENFNAIPGLGRALKFTFTLYDSKGVIKEGRTFTNIVYLGD